MYIHKTKGTRWQIISINRQYNYITLKGQKGDIIDVDLKVLNRWYYYQDQATKWDDSIF